MPVGSFFYFFAVEREIDGNWSVFETKMCKACNMNTSLNAAEDR